MVALVINQLPRKLCTLMLGGHLVKVHLNDLDVELLSTLIRETSYWQKTVVKAENFQHWAQ